MFRRTSLALALVLTPALAAQDSNQSNSARVEVQRGRAVLIEGDQAQRTVRAGENTLTDGATHIEVGAGSEVRLSWPGRASVQLWGPASLQWRSKPEPKSNKTATQTWSESSLEWKLFDIAWADFEVRRGQHRLDLPGDWRADLGVGALHLRGLASGPLELRHHAGSPTRLTWHGEQASARPPLTLYSGSTVRLERPSTAPIDESSNARVWEQPSWPYRAESDTPKQVQERVAGERQTNRPQGWPSSEQPDHGAVAKVPEFTERSGIVVEVEPIPDAGQPGAATPQAQRTPLSPLTGAPAVQNPAVTQPVVPEHMKQPAAPIGFDASAWGGFSLLELNDAGTMAVQKGEGVEVRLFTSGRRKVFVDPTAMSPAWAFGPQKDYLLHPGAVAVFEADGSMRMSFGSVDIHDAPADRPRFDQIAR